MYMKEHRRKSRPTKFWKRARAICNLHPCYKFALVLHENTLVFSQSEAPYFFMYIITEFTGRRGKALWVLAYV